MEPHRLREAPMRTLVPLQGWQERPQLVGHQ